MHIRRYVGGWGNILFITTASWLGLDTVMSSVLIGTSAPDTHIFEGVLKHGITGLPMLIKA